MTPKQSAFLREYLLTGNAREAYKRAYGVTDDNSASANSSILLKHPKIKAALEAQQKEVVEKNAIDVAALIAELNKLAFSNITRVVTWTETEAQIKPSDKIADADSAAISEFTETDNKFGKRRSIKLYSKTTAIEMLLKLAGAFSADNQQKQTGVNIFVNEGDLDQPES